MDVKAVKARRQQFADKFKRNKNIWKAEPGVSNVRVVPSILNADDPFQHLWWHWNIGKRGYLCLKKNKNEDCPICNMASEMWNSDEEEDKEISKKMFANVRFYAPVVARGEEEEGVKWWGISQTTYDDLTNDETLDQVGDYTDVEEGRDVIVTVKTKKETGTDYGSIKAKIAYSTSPLSEDREIIENCLTVQPDLEKSYPYNTADELHKVLKAWLFPDEVDEDDEDSGKGKSEAAPKSVKLKKKNH